MSNKNLIIFDVNSHFHRAFEGVLNRGLREKENSFYNGKPNYMIDAAINLVENELKKLKRHTKVDPDYIVCALDAKGENFRHRLYPDYKGTRPESNPEFDFMSKCCAKILQLKGYFLIEKSDVEADDVIATICKKVEKININTYVCTGDKDMLYLINDKTKLFAGSENNGSGVLYDIEGCIKKKGVQPKQINDFLTMDGDKADNIIGIPQLGKKKIPIILEHYTLEEIINEPALLREEKIKIKGKESLIKYIKENKDFIKLMQSLVTMKDDLELGVSLKDFIKQPENKDAVQNARQKLGLIKEDLAIKASLNNYINKYDTQNENNVQASKQKLK